MLVPTLGMEPLAFLATQPVWQAAQPITVNVDYDGPLTFASIHVSVILARCVSVPAFGAMDEVADLQEASAVEYSTAKRCSIASLSNLLIFDVSTMHTTKLWRSTKYPFC